MDMEEEFLEKMKSLKKPDVQASQYQQLFKLTLVNTQKSAFWGVWFLVVPLFFFACVVMKYLFNIKLGLSDTFIETMAALDTKSSGGHILTLLLFIVLPMAGIVLNLLSVMHFVYDKAERSLVVTLKLRWFNIVLAVISLAVVAMVCLYAITENARHHAREQYSFNAK
jgi:hypothetical protein